MRILWALVFFIGFTTTLAFPQEVKYWGDGVFMALESDGLTAQGHYGNALEKVSYLSGERWNKHNPHIYQAPTEEELPHWDAIALALRDGARYRDYAENWPEPKMGEETTTPQSLPAYPYPHISRLYDVMWQYMRWLIMRGQARDAAAIGLSLAIFGRHVSPVVARAPQWHLGYNAGSSIYYYTSKCLADTAAFYDLATLTVIHETLARVAERPMIPHSSLSRFMEASRRPADSADPELADFIEKLIRTETMDPAKRTQTLGEILRNHSGNPGKDATWFPKDCEIHIDIVTQPERHSNFFAQLRAGIAGLLTPDTSRWNDLPEMKEPYVEGVFIIDRRADDGGFGVNTRYPLCLQGRNSRLPFRGKTPWTPGEF